MSWEKTKAKAYAYDKIKDHLKHAVNDGRRREQKRARIAMRHIAAWFKEGKEYTRPHSVINCKAY